MFFPPGQELFPFSPFTSLRCPSLSSGSPPRWTGRRSGPGAQRSMAPLSGRQRVLIKLPGGSADSTAQIPVPGHCSSAPPWLCWCRRTQWQYKYRFLAVSEPGTARFTHSGCQACRSLGSLSSCRKMALPLVYLLSKMQCTYLTVQQSQCAVQWLLMFSESPQSNLLN